MDLFYPTFFSLQSLVSSLAIFHRTFLLAPKVLLLIFGTVWIRWGMQAPTISPRSPLPGVDFQLIWFTKQVRSHPFIPSFSSVLSFNSTVFCSSVNSSWLLPL